MRHTFHTHLLRLAAAFVASALLTACAPTFSAREEAPYPEPKQTALRGKAMTIFVDDNYWLSPVARFEVDALVRGSERYRWGELSAVAPVDFALAWGKLAEPHITPLVEISQSGRWFHWKTFNEQLIHTLGRKTIEESMANMHMIPADDDVRAKLLSVREGHAIRAKGFLVNVMHRDANKIKRTSRVRNDTGAGGCEIFYVIELEVLDARV